MMRDAMALFNKKKPQNLENPEARFRVDQMVLWVDKEGAASAEGRRVIAVIEVPLDVQPLNPNDRMFDTLTIAAVPPKRKFLYKIEGYDVEEFEEHQLIEAPE